MRVIDVAEHPPGCDVFTQSDIGPFIDTEVDIDDLPAYGRIMVARNTVEDWGQHFGMLPNEASARLQARLVELEGRCVAQAKTIADLRAAIGSMQTAGFKTEEFTMPTPTPSEAANTRANAQLAEIEAQEAINVEIENGGEVPVLPPDAVVPNADGPAPEVPEHTPVDEPADVLADAGLDAPPADATPVDGPEEPVEEPAP